VQTRDAGKHEFASSTQFVLNILRLMSFSAKEVSSEAWLIESTIVRFMLHQGIQQLLSSNAVY